MSPRLFVIPMVLFALTSSACAPRGGGGGGGGGDDDDSGNVGLDPTEVDECLEFDAFVARCYSNLGFEYEGTFCNSSPHWVIGVTTCGGYDLPSASVEPWACYAEAYDLACTPNHETLQELTVAVCAAVEQPGWLEECLDRYGISYSYGDDDDSAE